jgi:hypothetical protein
VTRCLADQLRLAGLLRGRGPAAQRYLLDKQGEQEHGHLADPGELIAELLQAACDIVSATVPESAG